MFLDSINAVCQISLMPSWWFTGRAVSPALVSVVDLTEIGIPGHRVSGGFTRRDGASATISTITCDFYSCALFAPSQPQLKPRHARHMRDPIAPADLGHWRQNNSVCSAHCAPKGISETVAEFSSQLSLQAAVSARVFGRLAQLETPVSS